MGKKVRCRKTYTSKGTCRNVSKNTLKLMPKSGMEGKVKAWMSGRSGWITVRNPNKKETNRPYVKISFENYFGGSYKEIRHRFKPAYENEG